MLPSIDRFRASAPLHHDLCSVVFTINTFGFEFSAQTSQSRNLNIAIELMLAFANEPANQLVIDNLAS